MKINSCPTCGGKVEFSPDDKALKCKKCANVFQIPLNPPKAKRSISDANLVEKDKGFEEWKESKRTFQCKNCGAQIILNKFEMTTKCSYCNTSSLVPTEKLPGLKPDAVIPFKISKDKANEQFKLKTKKRMFLPNDFKQNIPKTQIGATYFSSFSFAMNVFATYNGIRAVTRTISTKNGTKTVADYVPFSGTIQHNFNDIVVESSDKIEQHQINSILPYYFKESYEYDDDFITGYNVGYYNQTVSEASGVARNEALKVLENMIKSRHGNVTQLSVYPKYSDEKFNYVLLPLYFINFKYKEKDYLNLMNGQTGKTAGKLPKSPLKVTLFTLFIILLVVGLPLLIVLLSMI